MAQPLKLGSFLRIGYRKSEADFSLAFGATLTVDVDITLVPLRQNILVRVPSWRSRFVPETES
jgi:hypothetical protein